MAVRKMEYGDFDAVLEMMKTFYASDALLIHPEEEVLRKTLQDCLEHGPYLEGYVLEESGNVVGYSMVAKSYSTETGGLCIWIEDIYICPQYRGRGMGSDFLQWIAQMYHGKAVRLRLEAEPENRKAMQVYEKAGFEVLGYTQLVKPL